MQGCSSKHSRKINQNGAKGRKDLWYSVERLGVLDLLAEGAAVGVQYALTQAAEFSQHPLTDTYSRVEIS